jgi:hypothetical protein
MVRPLSVLFKKRTVDNGQQHNICAKFTTVYETSSLTHVLTNEKSRCTVRTYVQKQIKHIVRGCVKVNKISVFLLFK